MAFLKVLLNIGLIFTATTALPIDGDSSNDLSAAVNYRLPDNVAPVHYDIELIPYIEEDNFTFDGKSHIIIEIRHTTWDISLHALNLTINETATLLINSDTDIYTPMTHNYDNETEIFVLHFDDELLPGIYSLYIQFIGILHDDLHGFFRTSYINEKGENVWLAASHFEASWARRAFPCWDEPALKATFNISIKHRRNYTAVSNMPIRYQSDNEDDMMWTHFDTTPIMSTYLVAFVVADYVRVPNADGTLNMWCRSALVPYSKFAQKVAQKARDMLTEYTNCTDKVPKMDHLAVPQLTAGAMENWGLIIYNEKDFIYNEKTDTLFHKLRVAVTAAHETAHQWFGNVVSPSWWSHLWLNEGFATFFEEYILNEIFKDWRIMDFFVVKVQQEALRIDVAKQMKPIVFEVKTRKEINSHFSYSTYGKAPAILRMLQHIITAEVFRNGIIKYLHKYQFSSATSDDLWSAFQAALDESDVPHNAYTLKKVMDTWIKQRNYPIVHVTRNYDTGETILMQKHFRSKSENEHTDSDKWWIPLTFTKQTNPDFSRTLPTQWLRPQDKNISIDGIDPNDWIIVNVQQMGFYRVNYDDSNWRKIANYLNSDNYTKIHVLNRAQIIDDSYHLMIADQLNIEIFLNLANYLSRETDFIILYHMFNFFEMYVEKFYKILEIDYFKQYILRILNEIINNVGYEEDAAENELTKLTRVNTLKWACYFDHSECKRIATIKLNEILANPETYRISTNLKEWIYCDGMMQANETTWNKLRDIYFIDPDKNILQYLTCSEDPDILINFLNTSVSDELIIQNNHYMNIIENIIQEHSDNDAVLDYILINLEKIIPRKILKEEVIVAVIFSVHSNERLDKISDFVKSNFKEETSKKIQNIIRNRKSSLMEGYNKFLSFVLIQNKTIKGS